MSLGDEERKAMVKLEIERAIQPILRKDGYLTKRIR